MVRELELALALTVIEVVEVEEGLEEMAASESCDGDGGGGGVVEMRPLLLSSDVGVDCCAAFVRLELRLELDRMGMPELESRPS